MADVSLTFPNATMPQLQRVNDRYLMELWIQSGDFSPSELRALNRCRRKKQVYSLACVMSGRGDRIRHGMLTREGPRLGHTSNYIFPNESPSTSDWSIWASGLRWLMNERGHCRFHLGYWHEDKLHREETWRYDPTTDRLYGRVAGTSSWKIYSTIQTYSMRRNRPFALLEIGPGPPADAQLATVVPQLNGWCILEGSADIAVPEGDTTVPTLREALANKLQEWGNTQEYSCC